MQTKLSQQVLIDAAKIDIQFLDIAHLSYNKPLASFGHAKPFSLIPNLDSNSISEYLEENDIGLYGTPPWVADGQHLGLTVFWKRTRLQEIIDENRDFLIDNYWPINAYDFAMKVNVTTVSSSEKPRLYNLIARCFNDQSNIAVDDNLILEVKNKVDFYRNNPLIFINTYDDEVVRWFTDSAKNLLGIDVKFIGHGNSFKEINQSKDIYFIDLARMYYDILKKPVIVIDQVDGIAPCAGVTKTGATEFFGPIGGKIQPLDLRLVESFFFQSVSNKYFWEYIYGEYDYPDITDESKSYLRWIINKANLRAT